MKDATRNSHICEEYKDGKEVGDLARTYGLTERRTQQILRANGVVLRPRTTGDKKPISKLHAKIGLALYNYRFDHDIELYDAANDLGWSAIKVRKVEQGVGPIELLDLLDIKSFAKVDFGELI